MAMRPPVGPPTLTRRTKILLVVAGVLILLTFVGNVIINNYIDWLWFGEVGFRGVFTTVLFTQFVTALAGGLLIGGTALLSFWLAYRSRPVFVPVGRPDDPLVKVRSRIQENLTLFRAVLGGVTGIASALLALSDWKVVLQFLNSTPFGVTDPEFGLDVGFYAFDLPFYRYLLNWLFAAVAIGFLIALITHYLFGGIRLTGRPRRSRRQRAPSWRSPPGCSCCSRPSPTGSTATSCCPRTASRASSSAPPTPISTR